MDSNLQAISIIQWRTISTKNMHGTFRRRDGKFPTSAQGYFI